jgi:hypothetical protein
MDLYSIRPQYRHRHDVISLTANCSKLRQADVNNNELFHGLLTESIDALGVELRDIAHDFCVSPATITRWRQGKNLPHRAVRRVIYSKLKQRVSRLQRRERRSMAVA